MNKKLLSLTVLVGLTISAYAQKGKNEVQLSGQVGFPTGQLADVAKTGYGFAAKGMYGFSLRKQQVTLEAGYNRFQVDVLPGGIDGYYSAIPIYTGYRYTIGGFHLEPQAGISINRVAGSSGAASASSTKTNFAWATSVSYSLKSVELGLRYQSSEMKDSEEGLTFVGIRLAYNLSL
uniref:outer membrane beta-barrel protein n=1 Tax=Pedobacter schmidteae TaxID=2201271 RepID=UPI000EB10124|nr:outer membrane beta-barrel protein [Pedobacter schmidteae]